MYRKRGGGCKIINDRGIHVSGVDAHLNEIIRKANFSEFVCVNLTNIHQRHLRGIDDYDSEDEEQEYEEVFEEVFEEVYEGNPIQSVSVVGVSQ